MKDIILLSLGGSLLVPEEIDWKYLKQFKAFVNRNLGRRRFIIAVGGGKLCRKYQKAAQSLGVNGKENLDWVGIMATRLNAELVRSVFASAAQTEVVYNPIKKISFVKPILIVAGYQPGWSTDYDTVMLAKNFKVRRLINLSNVDFVYDKDPKKYPNAAPLQAVTWNKFRKIVGSRWIPGANLPFDPVAAKVAQKAGMEVIIANGKNLKNLQNILDGKKFTGTRIK